MVTRAPPRQRHFARPCGDRGITINYYSMNYGCWGASCDALDNNGNLMKQEIDIPGSGGFAVQWFSYDALNRLQAANETWHNDSNNTDSNVWKQTFAYDRYGNRYERSPVAIDAIRSRFDRWS